MFQNHKKIVIFIGYQLADYDFHGSVHFSIWGANNTRLDGRAFSPSQKRQQCGRQTFGRTQIVSQIKLRRRCGGVRGCSRQGWGKCWE